MRLPIIKGTIRRRLLVNFRAAPDVVQRILPTPFRPKLHNGQAIIGICLIRLEQVRPAGLPSIFGISSENAAHRIAVEWSDNHAGTREGVFIPRRDTGSLLNSLAGGRIFPGEHHRARFIVRENGKKIDFAMNSLDGKVNVHLIGIECEDLPQTSCFSCLAEASTYFEQGSLGYSVTADPNRMDGLQLRTLQWQVSALSLSTVYSSFFEDKEKFPDGSVQFDHALIMRDIEHEWHKVDDMYGEERAA